MHSVRAGTRDFSSKVIRCYFNPFALARRRQRQRQLPVTLRSVLTTLAIANYRSLRDLVAPLGALNVVTGANGSGKSNLYRALRLLADAAQGTVTSSLAREGGLESTLWAGPQT